MTLYSAPPLMWMVNAAGVLSSVRHFNPGHSFLPWWRHRCRSCSSVAVASILQVLDAKGAVVLSL